MKKHGSILITLVVASSFQVLVFRSAFATPRAPLPALPQAAPTLFHTRFDEAYWDGGRRAASVTMDYGTLVESFSGYALQRAGKSVVPLVVPALDAAGQLGLVTDTGAVGFWFKPEWTSAAAGGGGPGYAARLVELVAVGDKQAAVAWSLQASAEGSALVLVGAAGPEPLLKAEIGWGPEEWHWVVLNYGAKTELWLDGALVAEGLGTFALPPQVTGLVLGSTVFGSETAGGEFEDVSAFRRPLTEWQVGFYYQGTKNSSLLGPISAGEEAALLAARAKRKTEREALGLEEGGGGMQMLRLVGGTSECVTNRPLYITNTVCAFDANQGWTVQFDVQGTNGPADIFTTTNLAGNNLTNSQWVWLERGPSCSTYQYTNQPAGRSCYVLGSPLDTDSDGLTDAFEKLVSKTHPNNPDADGDGMLDGWEVQNGLDPLVNDANDDPDGDWFNNLLEYNGGTNSTNPRDVMVVTWGQNVYGQLIVPENLRTAVAVTGGQKHSLALRADGTVKGWGDNSLKQADVPPDLSNVIAIAANGYIGSSNIGPLAINLALKSNGTVTQWGTVSQAVPANLLNVSAVAAGADYALALRNDGSVVIWGETNQPAAQLPVGLTGVRSITAGFYHTAAVLSNGTVAAWGINYPTLGYTMTNIPPGLSNVVAVSAKALHTVALSSNGTVVAWGYNQSGQTNVPAGLSKVTAIAAGAGHSMALKQDGTVAVWGSFSPLNGLDQVSAIGAGWDHCLAVRSGRLLPFILLQPVNQTELPGTNVTFSALGLGLAGVKYQWQFNGVNLTGQTNAALTTTNAGGYTVVISTGAGSVTSSVATLTLIGPPVITNTIPLAPSTNWLTNGVSAPLNLSVQATALETQRYPLRYQWFTNGVAMADATNSSYNQSLPWVRLWETNSLDGVYTVKVWNPVGTNQSGAWTVRVFSPMKAGSTVAWGNNANHQAEYPIDLTNTLAIAAGRAHGVSLQEDGRVRVWGDNTYGQTNVPSNLSNVVAVAAGDDHSLALNTNRNVIAWGRNTFNQTNAPTTLTNAVAVSAGGSQSLALRKDSTVVQWGQTYASIPSGLSNVTAIASGTNFHLALRSNSTVVAWGLNNFGQTNVPSNLSNVVAIAAGGFHALAVRANGTVVSWGANGSGQTNVPAGLSNVMAVAAGWAYSAALKNDGTVVGWGDNTYGQTNAVSGLGNVKSIAAGANTDLAAIFSPLVQYPVDVTKDLLLIYNTNSADSIVVKNYYLAHRPMVSGANVLGIGCTNLETFLPTEYTNVFAAQVQGWLTNNPTKRPQYVILFSGIPSRVNTNNTPGVYQFDSFGYAQRPSVQYQLHDSCSQGWQPFVSSINMGTVTDCTNYIQKLESIGSSNSTSKVFLSASAGTYGNTNYVLDNIRHGDGYGQTNSYDVNFSDNGDTVWVATNGLIQSGVPWSAILYTNGLETAEYTNSPPGYIPHDLPHITNAVNVAGYISWGFHSSLRSDYATTGPVPVKWTGNSSWYLIETIESFNGQRAFNSGNFMQWFSSSAFGGTNYSNTPVGAVTHVDEPRLGGVNNANTYFRLWSGGKNFAICAWNSRNTVYFQAVGDPLVTR